jgi:hypothetical protein
MEENRPLRAVLFMYELARLAILVGVAGGFVQAGGAEDAFPLPWPAYMVPNGLFLLMALFLWLDMSRYRPYLFLYMAGKTIAAVSFLGWSVFAGGEFFPTLTISLQNSLMVMGSILIMLLGDLLSLAGAAVLLRQKPPAF